MVRSVDLVIILAAYWISVGLRQDALHSNDIATIALAGAIYSIVASTKEVYLSWRIATIAEVLRQVLMTWVITLGAILVCDLFFTLHDAEDRSKLMVWAGATAAALLLWHGFIRLLAHRLRCQGQNSRRAAIIGLTPIGCRLWRQLEQSPWMGLQFAGFFDDRGNGRIDEAVPAIEMLKGTTAEALAAARRGEIDLLFIALPIGAERRIETILNALRDAPAEVYYAHDYQTFDLLRGRLFLLDDLLVVGVHDSPLHGMNAVLKRCVDVVLSSAAIVLLALPMLLIAIGVKLSSPGPVIFRQRRYGLAGKAFDIYKFRTMTVMEDGEDVRQASPSDPRVTPFGRFLRRTSLDELPQLFNVLTGEMSLVGPRPHAASHNEYYRQSIKSYMLRHTIKPGITGWAQVHGWRGETQDPALMAARVRYDLEYIRSWTLMLDLKILGLTLVKSSARRGAY